METNLTLPILLSHVAHGAKIIWGDKDIYTVGFESEIDFEQKAYPLATLKFAIDNARKTNGDQGFKLLLRPMSDLTKEIEHNGERFVPIIELAKMAKFGSNQNNEQPYKECGKPPYGYEADQFRPYYHCWHQFRRGQSYQIIYDNFGLYIKEQQQGWYANYAVNIFEMNQKLLEWKFDIFGLLESGDALNLNEILNETKG